MVGVLNITLLLTNKKLDFSQLKHNIITKKQQTKKVFVASFFISQIECRDQIL